MQTSQVLSASTVNSRRFCITKMKCFTVFSDNLRDGNDFQKVL